MKYLQKTWIRVIVSLFAGGIISEIIHISTGDPNRPRAESDSLVYLGAALVIYLILTSNLKKNL